MDNRNPFVFDGPVDGSDIMIPRAQALSWVSGNLKSAVTVPLIIEGPPGSGKTTFLYQVKKRALNKGIVPIYVNLKALPRGSYTDFLWGFGKSIVHELSALGLSTPLLEKRMLILRPWQAFKTNFWNELLLEFSSRHLLLLLDDFESLATSQASPESNRVYRQYLYELLEDSQHVYTVATISDGPSADELREAVPISQSLTFRLANFSEAQTYELLCYNRFMHYSTPVANYIYSLTWGHPRDIQRLCHAVFERMQARNLRVVTVADVVSALRTELKPADFGRPIFRQRAKVSYLIPIEQAGDSGVELLQ